MLTKQEKKAPSIFSPAFSRFSPLFPSREGSRSQMCSICVDLWNKTIILWDVVTHNQLATLSGHADWVYALAVFSNASTGYECLASGSEDGTIILWDPRKYCALATLCGHDGSVCSLCVCRNSSGADILASGGADKMIRVWELTTHETVFTLAGHEGSVSSLSCFTNADGVLMLVSGCSLDDQTLRVWDLESRVSVATVQRAMPTRSLVCVAGADGRVLAVCTGGHGDAAVRAHDLFTGESAIELSVSGAKVCVAFVDRASGVPYLAASGWDSNGSKFIELICARTEETVSP
jgi:WD40 repeat protein